MTTNKVNLHVVQFLEPIVTKDPFLQAAKMLDQAAQNDSDIQQAIRVIMDWGAPIDIESLDTYRKIRRQGIKSYWPDETEGIVDVVLGAGYLLAESALRAPLGLKTFAERLKDGKARRKRVEQMLNTLEPNFVGVLLAETERLAIDDADFANRLAQASDHLASLQTKFPQFSQLKLQSSEAFQPQKTNGEPGIKAADDPSRPVTICEITATTTTAEDIACATVVVVVVVIEVLIKVL